MFEKICIYEKICCTFAANFKNNTKMATQNAHEHAHAYVAYYRVSTRKQGLGLDAQQTTVQQYIANHGGTCIAEYSEKESGKGSNVKNRTQLWAALDECKKTGATLILAKLDRLARDVVFTMTICNSGVDIVFCDLPQVNTMVLGIFATVAQYERELCSERTRKALAERKRQGVALGSNNGASHRFSETDRENAHQARRNAAKENDNNRKAWHFVSTRYRRKGATMERIAMQLNAEHYATPSGKGEWRGNMVARLVARYGKK
jgi:DNA invertase Pin-like site-specific DNA recombinase